MIRLKIGNSTCLLSDIPKIHYDQLRKVLSYLIPDTRPRYGKYKKMQGIAKVRKTLLDKHGSFPTGILYLVEDYLETKNIQYLREDSRIVPVEKIDVVASLPFTPYKEQQDAALAVVREGGRGIVVAPTGSGKSVMISLMISLLKVRTLVVVPSLELKYQLTDTLREVFGKNKVGPLHPDKGAVFPITIENIDQVDIMPDASGIDCVIIDEFHRSASMTYRRLNELHWGGIYYRIGLTATAFRTDEDEKLLLESVLSKKVYELDYQTALAKGYIVPAEFYVIELPKLKVSYVKYQDAYEALVVDRKDKNELTVDLIESLHDQGIAALVLVNHVRHGKILQQMALERGIMLPYAQGTNPDNKSLISDFNAKLGVSGSTVLLATHGIFSEGVDSKSCEYVIMAGGGKSKSAFMQRCGRGFRRYPGKDSCKVIMFRDPTDKRLLKHYELCEGYVMEEYGCEVYSLEA